MTDLIRVRRVVFVALAAALIVGLLPGEGLAYHRDRYRNLQEKIAAARQKVREAEAREHGLMARLADSDRRRLTLERDLAILTDRLNAHASRLRLLNARLDRLAAQLALWTLELEHALGRLEDQQELLQRRAADIYISAPMAYSTVLLGQHDFRDFVAADAYAQTVLRTDVRILEGIRDAKQRVQERRRIVRDKKLEMARVAGAVEREANRVAGVRSQQAAARDAVVREMNYRRRLLAQVRTEKEAYERALRSYIEESAAIEAFLRGRQRGQTVIRGRGGYLKWPVSGRVTSGYGWRTHPIYKRRSFHTGIDVAAPSGRSVGAARYGEVLYTGHKGAYGLIVLIDHGRSVATMYSHLSRVYVRPGQRVSTLESVGAVGCSGWCTGPHLHFEVRVQGEPQNPSAWL